MNNNFENKINISRKEIRIKKIQKKEMRKRKVLKINILNGIKTFMVCFVFLVTIGLGILIFKNIKNNYIESYNSNISINSTWNINKYSNKNTTYHDENLYLAQKTSEDEKVEETKIDTTTSISVDTANDNALNTIPKGDVAISKPSQSIKPVKSEIKQQTQVVPNVPVAPQTPVVTTPPVVTNPPVVTQTPEQIPGTTEVVEGMAIFDLSMASQQLKNILNQQGKNVAVKIGTVQGTPINYWNDDLAMSFANNAVDGENIYIYATKNINTGVVKYYVYK